ncbi:MAG TPA: carboxymuconolactone decarboxylase family protein [Mycobacteriales bacterium]|nr:carboxymuconolactone decarboxylase family protein [Mycobacteriales bacterium]
MSIVDPRATHAPQCYELLRRLDADVDASLPTELAELARRRVGMTLGVLPWEPMPDPDVAADFAEQFVVDVTGVDVPSLVPRLGDALVPFVKAMWVIDLGLRTDLVLGQLFEIEIPPRLPHDGSEEPLGFDPFLRAVAVLDAMDPLTTELVRLRVARHHNCRLCKSLRTRAAMQAGGDEDVYDKIDRFAASDLDDRQKTALQITEAIIIRPDSLDVPVVRRAREHFTDGQLVELVLDVMRNSANKVAVAFGADAPNVSEGLQAYDIGPDGDMVMGEPLAGVAPA